MAYINVDVNMEDLDTDEIADELERRGFLVVEIKFPDNLIEHVENIGFNVLDKKVIYKLYSTWRTCDGKTFEKELCEFFSEVLNEDIRL
mgnify:CR=1 FL=1